MVLSTRILASTALTLLASTALADFQVFYGTTTGYGIQETDFYWMNNPPDCNDFGAVTSYLLQVDDWEGSAVGAECTNSAGEDAACFPDETGVSKLQWRDDDSQVSGGQMTSCALGAGAAIQPNDSGSYDLVDSTGAVRGNCVFPAEVQHVDCPADYIDFSGSSVFACVTDCVALGSN